jgi:hypothetical protein
MTDETASELHDSLLIVVVALIFLLAVVVLFS